MPWEGDDGGCDDGGGDDGGGVVGCGDDGHGDDIYIMMQCLSVCL